VQKAPAAVSGTEEFRPQETLLHDRTNKIIITDGPVPSAGSKQGQPQVAEGQEKFSGGGLQAAPRPPGSKFSSSAPILETAAGHGNGTVVDVGGPTGTGGSENAGRRTILDYGQGKGGGGGSLAGRGVKLAEAVDSRAIVEAAPSQVDAQDAVVEVKAEGNGVSMTISGQISGRRILASVSPHYSEKAKRNGWEGAVAVHFTVLADGRVKDNMYFEQTSAHRDLNRAAMAAIKEFRFAPLANNQTTVEQWGVITFIFRLH
jgi:TonB family protein